MVTLFSEALLSNTRIGAISPRDNRPFRLTRLTASVNPISAPDREKAQPGREKLNPRVLYGYTSRAAFYNRSLPLDGNQTVKDNIAPEELRRYAVDA